MFIYCLCVALFLPYFCYGIEVYEKEVDPEFIELMKKPESDDFKKDYFLKKDPSIHELNHYILNGSRLDEPEEEKTNTNHIGYYMIPYFHQRGTGLVLKKCKDKVIELKMGSQCSVYSEKKYYKLLAAVLRDWMFGSTQYGLRFEDKGHPIRSYWENRNIGKKIKRKIQGTEIKTKSLVSELKGLKRVLENLDFHFVSMGMFITQSSRIKIFDLEHPYKKNNGNRDEYGIINGMNNLIAIFESK